MWHRNVCDDGGLTLLRLLRLLCLQLGQRHSAAIGCAWQRARYGSWVDGRNAGELEESAVVVAAGGRQFRREYRVHAAVVDPEWDGRDATGDVLRHLELLLPAFLVHGISNRLVQLIHGAGAFRVERERLR